MCHLQVFSWQMVEETWGCKKARSPGEGSQDTTFGFQGDQRDEEEETQMKKSESEVEVRAGGTRQVRPAGAASVEPCLALPCPDPFLVPSGGSGHYCPTP